MLVGKGSLPVCHDVKVSLSSWTLVARALALRVSTERTQELRHGAYRRGRADGPAKRAKHLTAARAVCDTLPVAGVGCEPWRERCRLGYSAQDHARGLVHLRVLKLPLMACRRPAPSQQALTGVQSSDILAARGSARAPKSHTLHRTPQRLSHISPPVSAFSSALCSVIRQ